MYYANAENLWYNNNIIKEKIMEENEWGSNEYPITLGYTLPNGAKYKVVIHSSDQSEDEYDKMFRICGQDILFSVD
jgi:hypothetical protein